MHPLSCGLLFKNYQRFDIEATEFQLEYVSNNFTKERTFLNAEQEGRFYLFCNFARMLEKHDIIHQNEAHSSGNKLQHRLTKI